MLDRATVADEYRAGRQHPSETPVAERATLVGGLDGRVVGFVDVRLVRPGGTHQPLPYGYIPELAVAARARGRGVGSTLVRAAEDWARERGCVYATLDFNTLNDDARRAADGAPAHRQASRLQSFRTDSPGFLARALSLGPFGALWRSSWADPDDVSGFWPDDADTQAPSPANPDGESAAPVPQPGWTAKREHQTSTSATASPDHRGRG